VKAAVLFADKDLRIGAIPDPQPGADEVLLAPSCAGICGTDIHVYRGEFKSRVAYPAVLGHEFGGVIEEVGKNVQGYRRGDRVVVDPIISCHSCPACQSGHLSACRKLKLLGIDLNGAFSEYVAVPSDRLFRLPDDLPMSYAPMLELYAVGHHILDRGRVQPGETVAILGAGRLGLSVLDVLCHSSAAARVFVTDFQPSRLAMAKRLGADRVIDISREDPVVDFLDQTDAVGVDCVIEAVGHYRVFGDQAPPLAQASQMVRHGGRIVTAGLGEQTTAVHFKTLVLKEVELIASRVTRGEFPRAIHLMSRGLLHPQLLISREMPAAEAPAAFAELDRESAETIKVVLNTRDWRT
jgi:threonine dehydrogenase-like Zn-dependent dehydrogenase